VTDYLLDTNHASYLMSHDSRMVTKLQEAVRTGDTFGISVTVLGELFFAVYASQHQQQNMARLMQMLNALTIYEFNQSASEEFGKIQAAQKAIGRPVPPLDAQIAAVASQQSLTILTADKHFGFIEAIKIENWLT
jgi:tRNA(fMet)-specific endonuclease VapC